MPVEKFAPVVGIKTQDCKGQRRSMRFATSCWPRLNTAGLRPLGMHIGRCQPPAKLSGHELSAVRHGVCLDKARYAHIPMLGANRDLFAQKGSGAFRSELALPGRPAGGQ